MIAATSRLPHAPVANRRFDRCTGLSDRGPDWRNSISANGSRDNESFRIVNDEWIEGSRRAFDDRSRVGKRIRPT